MNLYLKDYFILSLDIFYFIILITILILLTIQGFKNIEYGKFKSIDIIKERVLYEQISYEIYNSIKNNIILDLEIQNECKNNFQPLNFTIKLNPNYNFKYTTNIINLFNKQFCVPIYGKFKDKYNDMELKYEELIKHSVNKNNITKFNLSDENILNNICEEGYKPCGLLDTLDNILCLPKKYNCPLNDLIISSQNNSNLTDNGYSEEKLDNDFSLYLNTEENIVRPIIISFFLSFDKPWDHEWQKIIGYKDSKKNEKDNLKREIFPFDNYDKYMTSVPFLDSFSFIPLNDILKWEKFNENLKIMIKEIEPSKFYYLFHKNYIGFKNYEELKQFQETFDIDDYKNNPMYKLSKTLRPYIASIVLCLITTLIILIMFVIMFILIANHEKDFIYFSLIIFAFLALIYFLVYISLYFSNQAKFKKIDLNFDLQIKQVFDLYNKRINQPIYKAAIILLFISVIPHSIAILIFICYLIYILVDEIKKYCGFCGLF